MGSNPTYSASFFQVIQPTEQEQAQRDAVVARILEFIKLDQRIKLPPFDPARSARGGDFALQAIEDNDFSGIVGPYRYQFEGEDDLLHLYVIRCDSGRLTPEEARRVVAFLLPDLPPALIWLRPGEFSQHFYFGHDELLA
ncbi:MAG TPA: hypothetical protein VHE55_11545 [Fimbriimonadaceae bacterium]|nr:hypothetical protein [Fimbriimonadaceae bacterium]